MAKIIDDETIENVCILAKLSLTDEAKEKAKQDMQKMLDYVEKLDELDTDGVEPLSHIFGDENEKVIIMHLKFNALSKYIRNSCPRA